VAPLSAVGTAKGEPVERPCELFQRIPISDSRPLTRTQIWT